MHISEGERPDVLIMIQARTGSSRLANKVLHKIKGITVLEHVINRMQKCENADEVIVATTVEQNDLEIVKICAEKGVRVYCGSEQDVLDRYYQAARLFGRDGEKHIVRITADCPMHDFRIVDRVIKEHFAHHADYTSNAESETFPDGLDVEVFRFEALEQAWREAKLASDREHVTQYIRRCETMTKYSVESAVNYREERWTLDEPEDEAFIKEIFDRLYEEDPFFGMEQVLEAERKEPELKKINAALIRNEGLLKSLDRDYIVK